MVLSKPTTRTLLDLEAIIMSFPFLKRSQLISASLLGQLVNQEESLTSSIVQWRCSDNKCSSCLQSAIKEEEDPPQMYADSRSHNSAT